MKIKDIEIGKGFKPFIAAELSGNHNQSIDRAFEIIRAAAECGVQAIKFQTATPEGLTLKSNRPEFKIQDQNSPWNGRFLYELYEQAVTPWEWHADLFKYSIDLGLIPFSTPFELKAVDFLEELNIPAYKIASFENNDIPLLKRVARTGKPIILSTGMANVAELYEALEVIRSEGNESIALLKTTSTYPASPLNTNVLTIPHMRDLFGVEVGLSDHTMGIGAAVAAVAHGATLIEKHLTLRRADGGVDSAFSMEPEEMAALVTETERAWQSLGRVTYGPTEVEKKSLVFRRSLYCVKDIKAGEVFSEENIRSIRPGHGLSPKYLDILKGMVVKRDVKRGEPLAWDMIG